MHLLPWNVLSYLLTLEITGLEHLSMRYSVGLLSLAPSVYWWNWVRVDTEPNLWSYTWCIDSHPFRGNGVGKCCTVWFFYTFPIMIIFFIQRFPPAHIKLSIFFTQEVSRICSLQSRGLQVQPGEPLSLMLESSYFSSLSFWVITLFLSSLRFWTCACTKMIW
jgi:hypothetical protein